MRLFHVAELSKGCEQCFRRGAVVGNEAASPQTAQHTRKVKARKLLMIWALDVFSELQLVKKKNLEMKARFPSQSQTQVNPLSQHAILCWKAEWLLTLFVLDCMLSPWAVTVFIFSSCALDLISTSLVVSLSSDLRKRVVSYPLFTLMTLPVWDSAQSTYWQLGQQGEVRKGKHRTLHKVSSFYCSCHSSQVRHHNSGNLMLIRSLFLRLWTLGTSAYEGVNSPVTIWRPSVIKQTQGRLEAQEHCYCWSLLYCVCGRSQ